MIKKSVSILAAVLLTVCAFAQAPQKMTYQAIVRNSSNNLVQNSTVSMRVSILIGSASGTPVYVEKHSPMTNQNGLLSIEIGGGVIVSGTYVNGIYWANGPYFLKTELDPLGGINYSIISTSELLSVPYSIYSHVSGFSDSTRVSSHATISDTSKFTMLADTSSYSKELMNPAMLAVGMYQGNGVTYSDQMNGEYLGITYINSNTVLLDFTWNSNYKSLMQKRKALVEVIPSGTNGSFNLVFLAVGQSISGTGNFNASNSVLTLNITDPWTSYALLCQRFW